MEIINSNPFKIDSPPEKERIFYLYMTEDPKMRPQIYFSFSGGDQNDACKYLGSFNMPMVCIQIKGTENECLQHREKLEKERTEIWEKWNKENGQKTS